MKLSIALLLSTLLLYGCAGEKVAQKQASKAAELLASLKQHTEQSVESYKFDRSQEYRTVDQYLLARAEEDSLVRKHRAMWQSAEHKDALELLKANAEMAGLAEIRNSAPFILITPPPAFNSPKLSSDEMKSLITRLNKLASPLAPTERLEFLLTLFEQAGKAYAEANKAAEQDNLSLLSDKSRDGPGKPAKKDIESAETNAAVFTTAR